MCSKEKDEDYTNGQKDSFDIGLQRCELDIFVQRSSVAYIVRSAPGAGV
jgi:hypothetical protein